MTNPVNLILMILLFMVLFVLCAIWHHITALRYRKLRAEKGKQYKWYQLFGKLNEIGFWVKFIAVVLMLLTLFICLHYLCCTFPHKLDKVPDFDYMGVVCTFFGVMVTLLVGWNIYNGIDIKNKMEHLDADQDILGDYLLKSQKASENSKAYMFRLMSQGWSISLLANSNEAKLAMLIGYAISGINIFLRNDNIIAAEKTLDEVIGILSKVKDIQLTKKKRNELLKLFNELPDTSSLSKIGELKQYLSID